MSTFNKLYFISTNDNVNGEVTNVNKVIFDGTEYDRVTSLKGSEDNPLTANDLNNNYIYWEYYSSFCVKNVTSDNVIYNLIDGSFSEDSNVYVKSGFDFTLKFQTRSGSDVRNLVYANSTDVATISPNMSSPTDLNNGQLYSYTIHGLSTGVAFTFLSDDDGMSFGNIHVHIV